MQLNAGPLSDRIDVGAGSRLVSSSSTATTSLALQRLIEGGEVQALPPAVLGVR
jgi:hypothetical protein